MIDSDSNTNTLNPSNANQTSISPKNPTQSKSDSSSHTSNLVGTTIKNAVSSNQTITGTTVQNASGQPLGDKVRNNPMEVAVEQNIEKAMKILKRKLIKEGLFKELKSRRYFEKPSERKKRKLKESIKKVRKEEARSKKNSSLI
jgi:small subunit ribosomal protein S21